MELIRVNEAADELGVSARVIRLAIEAGSLKAYRLGQGRTTPFLVDRGDLFTWVRSTATTT